jgi:hypothetical protein
MSVIIDGVEYIPIQEARRELREAISRAVNEAAYGEDLPPDNSWKEAFESRFVFCKVKIEEQNTGLSVTNFVNIVIRHVMARVTRPRACGAPMIRCNQPKGHSQRCSHLAQECPRCGCGRPSYQETCSCED